LRNCVSLARQVSGGVFSAAWYTEQASLESDSSWAECVEIWRKTVMKTPLIFLV
jgi:hypothetical protein